MTDLQLAVFIIGLAIAWVVLAVTAARWAVDRYAEPKTVPPHLWIVPSDWSPSSVHALRDSGPYDWAADEPAGGAA